MSEPGTEEMENDQYNSYERHHSSSVAESDVVVNRCIAKRMPLKPFSNHSKKSKIPVMKTRMTTASRETDQRGIRLRTVNICQNLLYFYLMFLIDRE